MCSHDIDVHLLTDQSLVSMREARCRLLFANVCCGMYLIVVVGRGVASVLLTQIERDIQTSASELAVGG
jgi:hypothetical protein